MKSVYEMSRPIVLKSRVMRVLVLLGIIFLLISVALFIGGYRYRQEEVNLRAETQKNDLTFLGLQKMAEEEKKKESQTGLFEKKSFASYDEVIPFIAYLEKLLSVVDPNVLVSIKNQEGEIFLNHYADYNVDLKLQPGGAENLFSALDLLYDSRFIVKPLDFSMSYNPLEGQATNVLGEVTLDFRLFLK
jgi:hypothetical protein